MGLLVINIGKIMGECGNILKEGGMGNKFIGLETEEAFCFHF